MIVLTEARTGRQTPRGSAARCMHGIDSRISDSASSRIAGLVAVACDAAINAVGTGDVVAGNDSLPEKGKSPRSPYCCTFAGLSCSGEPLALICRRERSPAGNQSSRVIAKAGPAVRTSNRP